MTGIRVPPSDSPTWIAVGALLTGGATYLTLVVVGRVLGAEAYGSFSVFWSAILISSFGLFLPVEQVVSRRQAGRTPSRSLRMAATRTALTIAVVIIIVVGMVGALGPSATGTSPTVVVAFAIAVCGLGVQFPARGTLAGSHRMRGYVAVISVDAVMRFGVIIGLAVSGINSLGPYVLTIGVTALLAGLTGMALCRTNDDVSPAIAAGLGKETAGLSVAMVCMQVIVNSPMLIAGFVADDPVAAGHLLALTTVARLSVFIAQAGQAAYVGRIAAATYAGDRETRRRLVRLVAIVIGTVAAATLAGMTLLGPPVIEWVYGSEFQVDRFDCALVGGGIAAYLIASVANDLSVSLEAHSRAGGIWLLAALLAVVPVLVVDDTMLRGTLPLLVGSMVAAALTLRKLMTSASSRMVL